MFEKFWRDNLKEIQENKFRFAAVCICFVFAVILLFSEDDDGEEIVLVETPAAEVVETVDANKNIVAVRRAENSDSDENITVVLGANSNDLYVHDPFQIPPKEKVESPPGIPTAITPPPVVQVSIPTEKFVLRGVAIIGENKSALVQKISDTEENLILEIGDILNGKKIVDISTDSIILEDGETLYLENQ